MMGKNSPLIDLSISDNQLTGVLNISTCGNLFYIDASVSSKKGAVMLFRDRISQTKRPGLLRPSRIMYDLFISQPPMIPHLCILHLCLQANNFSGYLPTPEAYNHLHVVHLSFNNLSSVMEGTRITDMSLAYNLDLSGELPDGITTMLSLNSLSLHGTNLSVRVTGQICR